MKDSRSVEGFFLRQTKGLQSSRICLCVMVSRRMLFFVPKQHFKNRCSATIIYQSRLTLQDYLVKYSIATETVNYKCFLRTLMPDQRSFLRCQSCAYWSLFAAAWVSLVLLLLPTLTLVVPEARVCWCLNNGWRVKEPVCLQEKGPFLFIVTYCSPIPLVVILK